MLLEHDGRALRRAYVSGVGQIEPRQRAQQRGLAASAFTQQRDEFAFADVEVECIDDDTAAIAPLQSAHRYGQRR